MDSPVHTHLGWQPFFSSLCAVTFRCTEGCAGVCRRVVYSDNECTVQFTSRNPAGPSNECVAVGFCIVGSYDSLKLAHFCLTWCKTLGWDRTRECYVAVGTERCGELRRFLNKEKFDVGHARLYFWCVARQCMLYSYKCNVSRVTCLYSRKSQVWWVKTVRCFSLRLDIRWVTGQ